MQVADAGSRLVPNTFFLYYSFLISLSYSTIGFQQAPPRLGNQYLEDSALRELLQRIVPEEYLKQWEGELTRLGWRVVEELPTYGKC